jgi:L-galactose dehydrogenase
MWYRPLGQTGLSLSALGYGASPLGSVFRAVNETEGRETVRAALDLGINYLDVSPYYGLTRAETVLGQALRGIPRHRFVISTKVGRYGVDQFDFSARRITASVDESLGRLGLDFVDILLAHDVEFGDLNQVIHETLPAMERLRAAGKCRFIGISALPLAAFRRVVAAHRLDCILSYCHYCLNDTALLALLPDLQARGMGVINGSPLAMGLLGQRPPPAWHPAPGAVKQAAATAAALCASQGVDLAEVALRFSLAQPALASTLVGTASLENLRRNVAWAQASGPIPLLAEVQALLAPIHNVTWPTGRPENA